MPYYENQAIAALVLGAIKGQRIRQDWDAQYIAVWPATNSGGVKATGVILRSPAAFHVALDTVVTTDGPDSAYLYKDTDYVFPLHPSVNTLCFIDAQSSTETLSMRWILPE